MDLLRRVSTVRDSSTFKNSDIWSHFASRQYPLKSGSAAELSLSGILLLPRVAQPADPLSCSSRYGKHTGSGKRGLASF